MNQNSILTLSTNGIKVIFIALLLFSYGDIYASDDYGLILSRVSHEITDKITRTDTIHKYLSSQKTNGSWNDINYKDRSRTTWDPTKHLDRIMNIAALGMKTGWNTSDGKTCRDSVNIGIEFWLNEKLKSDNWWHNRIGATQVICKILALSNTELTEKNRTGLIDILKSEGAYQDKMTGTNRTWIAANNFILAIVAHDEIILGSSIKAMTEELHTTVDEGLQPDWSYHQHGPMLQTGNYGNSFLATQTELGLLLVGTKWALSQKQIDLLSNYVIEHSQWPLWNKYYDISACGRQMDSPNSLGNKGQSLARIASRLAKLDTTRSTELGNIQDRFEKGTNDGGPQGVKYWWRSDYLIQRTLSWTSSLKMYSSRVMSVETNVNDENKLGAYLNDGALWVRVTGDEYDNIQPVLDWRKIPGITGIDTNEPVKPKLSINYKTASSWTGAATDGEYATAAMEFKRDGVNVRKGWFFLPWGIVAVGYDMNKNDNKYFTSINQSRLRGHSFIVKNDSTLSETRSYDGNDIKGVWHDNTGYIIQNGQNVILSATDRKGKWTDIRMMNVPKEEVTLPVFFLYLTGKGNAGYEYAVLPDMDRGKFQAVLKTPLYTLVENSGKLQAIEDTRNMCAGMIFWEKGNVNIHGLKVSTDNPCILNLIEKNHELHLTVSDPSQKLDQIKIIILGNWNGGKLSSDASETEITIVFPKEGMAGSSVKKTIKR